MTNSYTLSVDLGNFGKRPIMSGPAGAQGPAGADGQDGLPGVPGTPGVDGKTWLSGAGAPSNVSGTNGDFYLDTSSSTWYGPKTAGAWGPGFSLVGAQGPQGPAGPASNDITSGAADPASAPASVGATYINTTTKDIFRATGTASAADWKKQITNQSGVNLTVKTTPTSADRVLIYDVAGGNAPKVVEVKSLTQEVIVVAVSDETTPLTIGANKVVFRMPFAMTLTGVRASVGIAPTGATLNIDVNEGGVSIFSTGLSIDAAEKTSVTAAVPAVISDINLADDAEISIDIDQVGSTIAGSGLKVSLFGYRP